MYIGYIKYKYHINAIQLTKEKLKIPETAKLVVNSLNIK